MGAQWMDGFFFRKNFLGLSVAFFNFCLPLVVDDGRVACWRVVPRVLLNGKPYYLIGPLDQGWFPDGLYTAATDAALRSDLVAMKKMGMNSVSATACERIFSLGCVFTPTALCCRCAST